MPEVLTRPVFKLILETAPEGAEITSWLLGKDVTSVTGREYGEVLMTLARPANEEFARALAERVSLIEEESASAEGFLKVSEMAHRELNIEKTPSGGLRFVATAGEYVVTRDFAAEADAFVSGGSLAATRSTPVRFPSSEHSWYGLELRPTLKAALDSLRDESIQLVRARMTMHLDGTVESLGRLSDVMQKYIRASSELTQTVQTAESVVRLTADEKRVLMQKLAEIEDHEVTSEARGYLESDCPEAFRELATRYMDAVAEVSRAHRTILQLPVIPPRN